ncbi:DUF1707 SHOCT-like domain-containing protein [Planobispora takensis]|uniref:Cell wall-active antibiotics response LiaF-like C-terminal domain-containing protein n=1 Tax=Planobispora takensis TaxID=1367882 RepID=A0A8J3SSY4_9ACTN|nr:DUF1707 domain-containing protein [Planobispora takensis]GIH99697.1 hypothetical protein Pta02_17060 [Planobispora takensis]
MNDPGGIRASDAEREAVVEQLRVASVEGRLTLGELTERTEAAYTAVTQAELAVITSDLPGLGYTPAPAPVPHKEGRSRRWFVAVMGDSKRRGKWRIDQELGAVAVMGDVVLDLREAEVRTGVVDISATAVMGDVKIIVPDGVDVELEGIAIMGDKKVQVIEAPPGMNVPVVRIKAFALMGDIKVIGDSRAEPVKKAWAAWREQWRELRGELTGEPYRPLPPGAPHPPQAPGHGLHSHPGPYGERGHGSGWTHGH